MTTVGLSGTALATALAAEPELSGKPGEFLAWLARGRRADSTIRWYAKHLRAVARSAPMAWERPDAIGEWIASAVAPATARGRRRAVGAYMRWLDPSHASDWLDGQRPVIPRPRGFDPLPIVLTPEQQRRLVDAARPDPVDYAAVLSLLDCGARVGEMANVALSDLVPGSVRLFGKTGARVVPLGGMATDALLAVAGNRWCFAGRSAGAPITAKGLANRLGRAFRRAGLPEGGAHALRHTFATTYIAGGGSLVRLQHILGHRSVSTTERYIHLAANDLARDHARLSPLAALGAGIQLRMVAG